MTDQKYVAWPVEEAAIAAGTSAVSSLDQLVLPLAPREQFHIGAVYDFSVPFGDVTARATYTFTGETFGDQANRLDQPSYEIINASLELAPNNSDIRIKVFGRNLGDEVYSPFAFALGRNLGSPRSYGIELTHQF